MSRIPQQKRGEIIQQLQLGNSQRLVAKSFGVSRCAVQAIHKKCIVTGSVDDRPKSGRPPKTSIRERRTLIRLSKKNPFLSASQLRNEWKTERFVSKSTVKNILRKYGLFGRIAARKPLLTNKQKKSRLLWCRSHLNWNFERFEKLIFSDETRIELKPRKQQRVRREIGNRFKIRYTQKTVRFGEKSLMIWGAIKANGQRSLVRCLPRVNAAEYQRVLHFGLMNIYESDEILVQDGAPCHTAKSTREFMAAHGIQVMERWPAQSPDLNIIENLWSTLKQNVARMQANTLEDLWNNCNQVWSNIPNETIRVLFDSIPSRISSVIRNKGSYSLY